MEQTFAAMDIPGFLPFEALLDAEQAAALLRVHVKTLQSMARAGAVPCVRMGKYWRFRASSLDMWVAEQLESDYQSRRVQ
jgi:excisionase family DNA binding protein